ncbi:MAG TPA: hypothetical protein VNH13_05250 [Candidatus Acidoferrales bacterium]|nr:hypothetical protein [Candidatus Acidoferrales bacterium]
MTVSDVGHVQRRRIRRAFRATLAVALVGSAITGCISPSLLRVHNRTLSWLRVAGYEGSPGVPIQPCSTVDLHWAADWQPAVTPGPSAPPDAIRLRVSVPPPDNGLRQALVVTAAGAHGYSLDAVPPLPDCAGAAKPTPTAPAPAPLVATTNPFEGERDVPFAGPFIVTFAGSARQATPDVWLHLAGSNARLPATLIWSTTDRVNLIPDGPLLAGRAYVLEVEILPPRAGGTVSVHFTTVSSP